MRHVLLATLLLLPGTVIAAPAQLPSSQELPRGSPWTTMHPDSFPKDPVAAVAACRLAAAVRPDDLLTDQKCERFGELLKRNECTLVSVPNGTVFSFMLYRKHNQPPYVQEGVLKDLRDAQHHDASLCDLGDGVWGYHFAADGACNNPAFVLLPPPKGRWVCEREYFGKDPTPPSWQYVPDLYIKTCCTGTYLPGAMIEKQGDTLRSRGYSETCYWIGD